MPDLTGPPWHMPPRPHRADAHGPLPRQRRDDLTAQLLALLAETPALSQVRIADRLGIHTGHLAVLMAPLLWDGRVTYVRGTTGKPNTYTVHPEPEDAR